MCFFSELLKQSSTIFFEFLVKIASKVPIKKSSILCVFQFESGVETAKQTRHYKKKTVYHAQLMERYKNNEKASN